MAIRVECPSCGQPIAVPDNIPGRKATCRCGSNFDVATAVEFTELTAAPPKPPESIEQIASDMRHELRRIYNRLDNLLGLLILLAILGALAALLTHGSSHP